MSEFMATLGLMLGGAQVWCLASILRQLRQETEIPIQLISAPAQPLAEPVQTCYYCNHQFPTGQLEQIGHYKYCPEHGSNRFN